MCVCMHLFVSPQRPVNQSSPKKSRVLIQSSCTAGPAATRQGTVGLGPSAMSSTGLKAEAAAEDATKLQFGEGILIFGCCTVHVGCSEEKENVVRV